MMVGPLIQHWGVGCILLPQAISGIEQDFNGNRLRKRELRMRVGYIEYDGRFQEVCKDEKWEIGQDT
jgi:hypothetical protein